MPGSRSGSRSRSRSRSQTKKRYGARGSPLGMRRTYRRPSVDKSAQKWAERGLEYPMDSRRKKSWAQKAIKDLWSDYKSKKARKHRALLATHKGKFAGLPQELQAKIYSMTKKKRSKTKGGYRSGSKSKKKRSRGRSPRRSRGRK